MHNPHLKGIIPPPADPNASLDERKRAALERVHSSLPFGESPRLDHTDYGHIRIRDTFTEKATALGARALNALSGKPHDRV